MKKTTLTFLLSCLAIIGFAQAPEYNYSIEFVSAAGSVETYRIVATATAAVPSANADEVDNFQLIVGWDAAAYELPTLVAAGNGEFGDAGNYIPVLADAATANGLPGGGASDKDIYSVSYPADGGTTSHPTGAFLIREFTVTRTPAGAGAPDPVILFDTDPNVVFLNGFGFGLANSMVVNNGGVLEERFNSSVLPSSLSSVGFDFNALNFTAYPNPTKGTLFVQNPSARDFNYEVVSITGRIVISNGSLAPRSQNKIELGGLNDGVYFLNIKSDSDDKKSIKIILN